MFWNIIRRIRRCFVIVCGFVLENYKYFYHSIFLFIAGLIILFIQTSFLQYRASYMQGNVPVLGWENGTNRNLTSYILPGNVTTVVNNEICSKSSPPYVLLIVCSSIQNYELRLAIRHTWAFTARQQFNISVGFLFGRPSDPKLNEQIKEENDIFGDIIIEDFVDTYNNLTLKTTMMLKWVQQNCVGAKFLMKTDDDVYVNLYNVILFLNSVPQKWIRSLLLGSLLCSAEVVSDSSNKWYMPKYMFSKKVYPTYVSGVGYIMSMDVAMLLYRNVFQTPLVHMEDVFITGICAETAGIKPLGHDAFEYSNRDRTRCSLRDVTLILHSHRLSPGQMFHIHYVLSTCDMIENRMFNQLNSRPIVDNVYEQNLLTYYSCSEKDMVPLSIS